MVEIRLGYPGFCTDTEGFVRPQGWFWGERGDVNENYDFWSDRRYIQAKESNFTGVDFGSAIGTGEYLGLWEDKDLFVNDLAENFIKTGKSFIVPIQTKSIFFKDVEYLKRVILPEEVRNYEKASIVFFDLEEASILPKYLEFFKVFCKNNKLNDSRIFILTANFNVQQDSSPFKVVKINFFKDYLWFLKGDTKRNYDFNAHLREISSIEPTKHFLCLSRRQTWERAALVGYIDQLPVESITSLGRGYEGFKRSTGADFIENLEDLKNCTRVVKTAIDYYSTKKNEIVLHSPDGDCKIYKNRIDCNQSLYLDTCISVVAETWFDQQYRLFFSEKIFKPMFCLRPFILVGVPGSLASLRAQGFYTFDRWWDESYDQETNLFKRLDLIGDLLDSLSKKSIEELQSMLYEMKPYLLSNYKKLKKFTFTDDIGCCLL